MIKRVFVFALFLIGLFLFLRGSSFSSASSNQSYSTSTYTFIIKVANSGQFDTDNRKVVTLDSSKSGKTITVPVDSSIFLNFPKGTHKIDISPNAGVVEKAKGKYHLPKDSIGLLKSIGVGTATVVITEKTPLDAGKVAYSASTSSTWSGYARSSGGPFTNITSNWTIPTASNCNLGDADSGAWIGIDGVTNSNLIQTGTESGCASGSAYYHAWWEILPSAATVISNTVYPGDNMYAEIKKNSTNWTITIKDLTQNWTYSTTQTYSGSQSSAEWIVEAPTVGGSIATLTNYGLATFLNDTQNGVNPSHSYSTDSIDMLGSDGVTVISSTSNPNVNTNGFSTAYGSTAPSAPAGSWTLTGNMYSTHDHTATLLPDGKVLVAAGKDTNPLSQAMLYDPTSHNWSWTGSLTTPRWQHSANLVTVSGGANKVLVAGGFRTSTLSSCELYSISGGTWSSATSMSTARLMFPTVKLSDGTILAIGGFTGSSGSTPTASVELYDPVANTWTTKASLATARGRNKAVLLNDGRVLVVGGAGSSGALSSTELYNVSTNTWSNGPSMAYTRDNPVMTLLPNGKVLVGGGSSRLTAEVFDPSNDTFSNVASMNYIHDGAQGLVITLSDTTNRVLIASGTSYSTHVELYDYTNNVWSVTNDMLKSRSSQTATLLSDGKVLMAAGLSTSLSSPAEYYTAP